MRYHYKIVRIPWARSEKMDEILRDARDDFDESDLQQRPSVKCMIQDQDELVILLEKAK